MIRRVWEVRSGRSWPELYCTSSDTVQVRDGATRRGVGGLRPYDTGGTGTEQLQYWGLEEHLRCGAVVVRRIAGIRQFVLSGREKWLGCCSKESLFSCNSICKMAGGLFVLYVVFRAGLILRLAFICVPWQLLWCF